ncbi:3157_t:CDS:1, partial [Gigaspora margarita]
DRAFVKYVVKLESWLLLSKLKLIAIWFTLLTAPRNSKVIVFINNIIAISSIKKIKKVKAQYKQLREKNFLIIARIHEIVQ